MEPIKEDQQVYLKVKIKSLVEETAIIRKEERKNKVMRGGLEYHRKFVVRPETRATLAAYGYIRGKTFAEIEPHAQSLPDAARVKSMVQKYCSYKRQAGLAAWWAEAETQVKENCTPKVAVLA